jgi:hypothetical protein
MSNHKRPCVILVADSNMAAAFRGYLTRDQWHRSLGCAPFDFNPDVGGDLLVDEGGNDPGVYLRAHELLRPYLNTHERVLVALDCEWDGSPGKQAIVDDVSGRLVSSGWQASAVKVIAIDPELENWLWQDNPLVAEALRYRSEPSLRTLLAQQGFGSQGEAKPRQGRKRPPNGYCAKLANPALQQSMKSWRGASRSGAVPMPRFMELHVALQSWFPAEDA